MNISAIFINRPVMTTLVYLAVSVFGVWGYLTMPVSDLPNVDYPVITVSVSYPGADPTIMASNVATPLEQQFLTIQGIETITSNNSQGYSNIVLQFTLDKSIDAAATDVQAAINRATGSLPKDLPSPPTFTKTNPNDQPIIYIGFGSASMTEEDMYDYIFTEVQQRLSIVTGVSQVQTYGTLRSVRVDVNPSQLALLGMSVSDISLAIQANTSMISAGLLKGHTIAFTLMPQTQAESIQDYENLVIASRDGAPIYLRDVAKVYYGPQVADMSLKFGGQGIPEGMSFVILAVSKADGANAVKISQAIRALMPEIQSQLPQSILMYLIYDRSTVIEASVHDVMETMIIAFVLVIIVIFLFLGRLRDTVVPALALPMSLLITFSVMRLLDYTIDNLSLLGLTLAIGFLVDDAIVFLENVVRRMQDLNEDVMTACYNGAKEISFTILAMTLSLSAVFIPLVFMSGIMGLIFRELGVTIIIAILASGFVSLSLTPMMCSRMLKPRDAANMTTVEKGADKLEHAFLRFYGPTLWWAMKHWYFSVAAYVLCGAGVVYLMMHLPTSFLPVGDSSFSFGVFVAPTGTSPDQMKVYQSKVEDILNKDESVQFFGVITGMGSYMNPNFGIVFTALKPRDQRPPIQQVTNVINYQISSIPGLLGVLTPQPTLEISTGATNQNQGAYAYVLSGLKQEDVYSSSFQLLVGMLKSGMFSSVQSDLFLDNPTLNLNLNREAAAGYGINATNFAQLLKDAYSENYSYLIKEPLQQYQVIVEVDRALARNPAQINLLYLNSQTNESMLYTNEKILPAEATALHVVPYDAVGSQERTVSPLTVNHLNNFNSVSIYFNVDQKFSIGQATNFIDALAAKVVPHGVMKGFQGQALVFKQTLTDMALMFIVALFVMYVILGILYESYLHPLTVLFSLFPALVGGLAALWVTNSDLSLYSIIGLFMLAGIVKKNAIMMIDFAVMHQAAGKSTADAVHLASMERFRPIIMTTLAAFFGIIPIAAGVGADAETRQPLGFVIVGGLILAQIMTLYVTPVTYMGFEWMQEHVLDKIPLFARSTVSVKEQLPVDGKGSDKKIEL